MYLCGYTLDNLSLMALTISTGFVVDDAIVVMENISRHIEDGMDPFAATLRGAKEIGFTVMTISISLIAVFIPLILMGGIVGRLFREFAVTLSTAILVSMVISLTTTPMMCAHLLKSEQSSKHGRLYMASERVLRVGAERFTASSLRWMLDNPGLMLTVLALTIALNVAIVIKIPKGFFPQQDTGSLGGSVRGPQDASFPAMNTALLAAEEVIKTRPGGAECDRVYRRRRRDEHRQCVCDSEAARKRQRKVSAADVINRLRAQAEPALRVRRSFFRHRRTCASAGAASNAMYQYTIQADNLDRPADVGAETAEAR